MIENQILCEKFYSEENIKHISERLFLSRKSKVIQLNE